MTPETSTSTHYFWWLGRNYNQDNVSLTQWMKDANARTFLEDKTVLEAQQRNMTREPNQRPVPSPADKGLTSGGGGVKNIALQKALKNVNVFDLDKITNHNIFW